MNEGTMQSYTFFFPRTRFGKNDKNQKFLLYLFSHQFKLSETTYLNVYLCKYMYVWGNTL
jgi:hypothetical protein